MKQLSGERHFLVRLTELSPQAWMVSVKEKLVFSRVLISRVA